MAERTTENIGEKTKSGDGSEILELVIYYVDCCLVQVTASSYTKNIWGVQILQRKICSRVHVISAVKSQPHV